MGSTSYRRAAAAEPLAPGARIGRYYIEERLARGGMGEVWLATAHGAGGFAKKVVLKTILPELAEDPAYVEMLINEASIAARLNHPNIVQVFDLECIEGRYFIAMEYLPGRTMNQVLQRLDRNKDRLPPWLAVMVGAQCCDGLQYAHDYSDEHGEPLGLLHRDISPSNIMLTFTGSVVILDFGIAKATTVEQPTAHGGLKGKFHYMPPERIRGLPGDRRSDVYSLGVVLYQLLAWRRPFNASNDAALLERILRDPATPLRRYAPWLGQRIEHSVHKALAKRPEDRHEQAAHLAAELRGYLRETGDIHEPGDLAEYLRGVFPDAPELRGVVFPSRDTAGVVAEEAANSDSGTIEIIEIDMTFGEDSILEVPAQPAADPRRPAPAPITAFGSSEPPAMPEEPVSVYDLAIRRTHPERHTEVADLFSGGARRASALPAPDLFGIRRVEPPAPQRDERGEAALAAEREPREPSWPWAPLPKKSS